MPGMAIILHKSTILRVVRILASIFLVYYAFRIIQELVIRYQPILAGNNDFPESLAAIAAFLVIAFAICILSIWFPTVILKLSPVRQKMGVLRWLLAVLLAVAISWLFLYSKWSFTLNGAWLRAFVYLAGFGAIAWLLTTQPQQNYSFEGLLKSGIIFGSVFIFASECQTAVSYPFSLSWSEGNRIWDYSVLYGRRLYDYPQGSPIPAYIDTGRQSLWGLPFLLPKVSIFTVRLWNALVFTLPYFLLGLFAFYKTGTKAWSLAAGRFVGVTVFTARTDLFPPRTGSNSGGCHPPNALVAWAFDCRSGRILCQHLAHYLGFCCRHVDSINGISGDCTIRS